MSWELNSGPLEEQPVLLPTEPSPQSSPYAFKAGSLDAPGVHCHALSVLGAGDPDSGPHAPTLSTLSAKLDPQTKLRYTTFIHKIAMIPDLTC